jgi:hypothetical protein
MIDLERAGRPTLLLVTDAFVPLAHEVSAAYGAAPERLVVVPHPLGATPESVLLAHADAVVDAALNLIRKPTT